MSDWLKTVYNETSSSKLNKHYKNWADEYDSSMKEWGYAYPSKLKKILKSKIKLNKNIKILDAGCGTGYVAEALKDIKTISTDEAHDMFTKNECNLIDIRDIRELEKEGRV